MRCPAAHFVAQQSRGGAARGRQLGRLGQQQQQQLLLAINVDCKSNYKSQMAKTLEMAHKSGRAVERALRKTLPQMRHAICES